MGGCFRVGLLRCVPSLTLSLRCLWTPLNFWVAVVCRWDGLAICAFTARVATRCPICPVTFKVGLSLGLSEVRGNHDYVLHFRCRVIVSTQYSTVWPKVLTGGSSVRSSNSRSRGKRMLTHMFRRRTHFSS